MFRTVILAALALAACCAAPAGEKAEPKGKEAAEKVKKLQTQRRDLLKKAVSLQWRRLEGGNGGKETLGELVRLSKELLQAELELAATPKERLAAHAERLETARKVEKLILAFVKAAMMTEAEGLTAQADRLEAEVGWLKAGGEEKKDQKDKEK